MQNTCVRDHAHEMHANTLHEPQGDVRKKREQSAKFDLIVHVESALAYYIPMDCLSALTYFESGEKLALVA